MTRVLLEALWTALVGFAAWCLFHPPDRYRVAAGRVAVISLLFAGLAAIYMRRWS